MLLHLFGTFFAFLGKFWRVPTRKFYAIKRPDRDCKDKRKSKKRPSHTINESSSDTDDFLPRANLTKKKCLGDGPSGGDWLSIRDDISAIRQDIQWLYQIDKRMKIPTALYRKLSDAFKCNICQHAPITPPVIFARCCKSIIGCQTCVDTWYRGDSGISKKCPLCGTDRALPETMRLHGLDDFLQAIQPILSQPQDTHSHGGDNTSSESH